MDPLHLDPGNIETTASRTPEQNSWGALIAIVVIMAIIIVGAFYAWGKRVAELHGLPAAVIDSGTTTDATTSTTTVSQ